MIGRRGIEDEPIEHGVEDVAGGACQNHGEAHNVARTHLLLHLKPDVVGNDRDGDNAKETQHQLVDKRHAVGHAVVLNEVDEEPRGDFHALVKAHVRLHSYLDDLVDQQDEEDEQ